MTTEVPTLDSQHGQIYETQSGKLKAEDQIIKSVAAARSIYQNYRTKHIKRSVLYSEIDGLIAGNPPYPPEVLRSANLQHIANFNDMSPRATYERFCTSFWNLIHNAKNLTQFKIRNMGKDPSLPIHEETLARNWKFAVLQHWPAFLVNFASLQAQIVKFGVSPAFFHDERDPRWRVIELQRFFVPDQASADLDLLTSFCVESEYTISYLWNAYKQFTDKNGNEKATSPWNTLELGKLLVSLSGTATREAIDPLDAVQISRKIYSGDVAWDSMFNDVVKIVSLFQKEYNGKISHYMFHRDLSQENVNTQKPNEGFLFYQKDQYERMNEALVLFTLNPGEATIHANRGFGHKIFSLSQAKIQTGCSVVDMAKWASSPIIKSSSLGSKDAQHIRWYPGAPTDIGASDFVPNTMGANIQQVIGVAQFLDGQIKSNVSYSGADPAQPDPDVGSLSPSQSRLGAWQEFSVQKNHIMWHYQGLDWMFGLMTAKMYYAKESYPGSEIGATWRERCLEDGVPEEILDIKAKKGPNGMPNHLEATAVRVAGAGSQTAQLMGLQEMQPLVPSMNVRQQKTYQAMLISAALGSDQLDAFDVDANEVDERAGGASLAAVENAVMQMGKAVVWSQDNEHRSHFATHMALASQIIQTLTQKQMDVVEADTQFHVLVPHLQEHLKALGSSIFTRAMFAQSKPMFDQVQRFATLNRKNAVKSLQKRAQDQQQAAANQARVMNEEELKTTAAMNEEKRKDFKLISQSQRQKEAGDHKASALERKTESDIRNKRRKTEADIAIKARSEHAKVTGNQSLEQAENDPSGYLQRINGQTPAPFDIENPGVPNV